MKNSAIGSNWKDVRAELFTKEEILESDLRVAIMTELIEARHEKGISQKKLEELSGVSQPVIARMETGKTSPQLDTVLKVLASLGKTLAVVHWNKKRSKRNQKELLWKQHKPPSRSTKPCGTQRMCSALRWMPMTTSLTFWE